MGQLKNSEEMLKFLNDLSRFSDIFSLFKKQEGGPDGPDRPSRPQSGGPNAPNAPPNGTGAPNAPDGGAPHSPPPKREKENPQTRRAGSRMNLSNNVWKNILSVIEAGAPNCYKSGRRNPNPFRRRRDRSPLALDGEAAFFMYGEGGKIVFATLSRTTKAPRSERAEIMPFKSVRA